MRWLRWIDAWKRSTKPVLPGNVIGLSEFPRRANQDFPDRHRHRHGGSCPCQSSTDITLVMPGHRAGLFYAFDMSKVSTDASMQTQPAGNSVAFW
jgi:hypothetical protein